MPAKKLYALAAPNTSSFGGTTEDVPAEALMSPQVSVATATGSSRVGAGTSAELRLASAVVHADFTSDTTAPKPANLLNNVAGRWNTWRAGPFTGVLIPGTWTFSITFFCISSNALTSDFSFFAKVHKSADPNGNTGVTSYPRFETDIRTATLTTSGVDEKGTLTGTWEGPEIELNNEYIFFSAAMKVHVIESNSNARSLGIMAGANTFLQTADLQPPGVTLIGAVGI